MSVLTPGGKVDRFEVEAMLGKGGLAEVYRVRHEVLGSRFALKVVTVRGSAVGRRLLREGRIQSQLRHPNIVAVSDVIEFGGHCALVLEYVEGATLEQWITRSGPMAVETALELFAQVLAGVTAAHDNGVLHRDLKPGNVMLAPSSAGVMAKVTDFGIAKVLLDEPGQGDTMQGLVMGTPGYMAPEQCQDSSTVDARADLFALGVILYEMLSGAEAFVRHDFASTIAATLDGHFTPLAELRPDVPAQVEHVVNCLLRVDPAARFADGRAVAVALYGDGSRLSEIVAGRQVSTPLPIPVPTGLTMMPAGIALSGNGRLSGGSAPKVPTPVAGETMVPGGAVTELPEEVEPSNRARWAAAFAAFLLMGSVGLIALLVVQPGLTRRSEVPSEEVAAAPAPVEPVGAPPAAAPAEPEPQAPVVAQAQAPSEAPRASTAPSARPPPIEATVEPAAPPAEAPIVAVAPELPVATGTVDAEPPAVEAAPAVAAAVAPDVAGTWKGNWGGRPLSIRMSGGGESVKAELDVLVGTAYRTYNLRGRIKPDGTLSLAGGAGAEAWMVNGTISGGQLTAMVMQGDKGKPTSFTAKRK